MKTHNGSGDRRFTLFDYEEKMLRLAEAMVANLEQVPEGLKDLKDAYRLSYREARRLLRISDRLQLDLHQANQKLAEQTARLTQLNEALTREIERRALLEQELRHIATIDELTGISNRRHLLELGEHEMHRLARTRGRLALLIADLDHFKRVNDLHGHATGDAALRFFATLFRAELRVGDIAGRIGGEEFLAMLPDTDLATATAVAERLRQRLAATPFEIPGVRLPLTVSIGVTEPLPGEPLDRAIARADRALYAAKHGGRDRVVSNVGDDFDDVSMNEQP